MGGCCGDRGVRVRASCWREWDLGAVQLVRAVLPQMTDPKNDMAEPWPL